MNVSDLLPAIQDHLGSLPKDYICIDTEYTGGDERTDFVMEIGHVLVRDRKVVDELNLVLNWHSFPGVDQDLLRHKLKNIKYHMGDGWRVTWDVMRSEGVDAYKVLAFYNKLFAEWGPDGFVVAHNGRKADERMLRGVFNRYLNKSFVIGDNVLWDTGALFRARAMLESSDPSHERNLWKMFPVRGDTVKSYCERVLNCRPGPKWSLSSCVESLGLGSKLRKGHKAHTAVCDAHASHLVCEDLRLNLATTLVSTPRDTVLDSVHGLVAEITVDDLPEQTKKEVLKNGWLDTPLPASVPEKPKPPLPETPTPVAPADARSRKRGQRVI